MVLFFILFYGQKKIIWFFKKVFMKNPKKKKVKLVCMENRKKKIGNENSKEINRNRLVEFLNYFCVYFSKGKYLCNNFPTKYLWGFGLCL